MPAGKGLAPSGDSTAALVAGTPEADTDFAADTEASEPGRGSAADTADIPAVVGSQDAADMAEGLAGWLAEVGSAVATAAVAVGADIELAIAADTAEKFAEVGTAAVVVAAVAVVDTQVADMRVVAFVEHIADFVALVDLDTDFVGLVQELVDIHKLAVVGIGSVERDSLVSVGHLGMPADTVDIVVLEGPIVEVRLVAGKADKPHVAAHTALDLGEENCIPGDMEFAAG